MKVEHITFGGSAVVRNTDDIYPETAEHFKDFQTGNIEKEIKNTPFICKVTVQSSIAIFDLKIKNDILSTNFCCFAKEDKEPVMLYIRDLTRKIDPFKVITTPHEDMFLYSIMIAGFGVNAMLAGEIELYIYDAIRRGIMQKF